MYNLFNLIIAEKKTKTKFENIICRVFFLLFNFVFVSWPGIVFFTIMEILLCIIFVPFFTNDFTILKLAINNNLWQSVNLLYSRHFFLSVSFEHPSPGGAVSM